MGRFAKSVCTVSSVFLLSLGSLAANQPAVPVTYNASVERVFAAEMQAFGTPPTSSEKGKCQVTYQSTGRYKLLWTASCKENGKGQVSVSLTAEGQWFFGVADEKRRVAGIFWNNMNVILKDAATSGGTPAAASPLVAKPAPAPSSSRPSAPAPALSPAAPAAAAPAPAPALAPLVALPASEHAAMVQISSEPSGADILVDGTYTGCTPSQLKLSTGPHSVRIVKKGFEPWQRSITVDSGEVRNVAAALETAGQ